jgi:hypothetical protein
MGLDIFEWPGVLVAFAMTVPPATENLDHIN